jgi:hypothetical protein
LLRICVPLPEPFCVSAPVCGVGVPLPPLVIIGTIEAVTSGKCGLFPGRYVMKTSTVQPSGVQSTLQMFLEMPQLTIVHPVWPWPDVTFDAPRKEQICTALACDMEYLPVDRALAAPVESRREGTNKAIKMRMMILRLEPPRRGTMTESDGTFAPRSEGEPSAEAGV